VDHQLPWPNLPAEAQLRTEHKRFKALRLGQYFCCAYLKDTDSVPGLFNEANEEKAMSMIREWLIAHQYTDQLPQPLERWTASIRAQQEMRSVANTIPCYQCSSEIYCEMNGCRNR
jgi:hypothetical protein